MHDKLSSGQCHVPYRSSLHNEITKLPEMPSLIAVEIVAGKTELCMIQTSVLLLRIRQTIPQADPNHKELKERFGGRKHKHLEALSPALRSFL